LLRNANGSTQISIKVLHGGLECRSCEIAAKGATAEVAIDGTAMKNQMSRREDRVVVAMEERVRLGEREQLLITVRA
jgi:hypothetical protein